MGALLLSNLEAPERLETRVLERSRRQLWMAAGHEYAGRGSVSFEELAALPYILPMVLWQGSACIFAALSHRPFQQGQARRYSLLTMGFNAVQLAVLLVPLGWAPQAHLWWLAGVCTAGLLALSAWMAK